MGYDHQVHESERLHPSTDAEMRQIGAELVRQMKPGDAALLYGDLGAGKTTLIRGAVAELGYLEPVRSPTFNIIQTFDTDPPILHADLYRVGSGDNLGIEDYADTHILFVEWPDEEAGWINRKRTWMIRIGFEGEGRIVTIESPLTG